MNFVIVPVVTLILLWLTALAALPFIGLWDRRRAASRRRALFDKSADQLGQATCIMQVVAAVLLITNVLGGGSSHRPLLGAWLLLLAVTAAASVAAALFSVLGWIAVRRRRTGRGGPVRAMAWAGGLCAALAAVSALVLGWAELCGLAFAPASGDVAPASLSVGEAVLDAALTALRTGGGVLPWLYALLWLFLAVAVGQGIGLCWHLLRRKADDYGRDYYTLIVGTRARQAAYAGAAALPFAAVFLWLTPQFRQAMPPVFAMPTPDVLFWGLSPQLICRIGSLGLLLAVLCWYLLARTPLPLRRKTLAYLALPLLWIGVAGLLGCLWA